MALYHFNRHTRIKQCLLFSKSAHTAATDVEEAAERERAKTFQRMTREKKKGTVFLKQRALFKYKGRIRKEKRKLEPILFWEERHLLRFSAR